MFFSPMARVKRAMNVFTKMSLKLEREISKFYSAIERHKEEAQEAASKAEEKRQRLEAKLVATQSVIGAKTGELQTAIAESERLLQALSAFAPKAAGQ
jgi:putative protein kinase ArgK-like GTPase of G3E family